MLPVKRETTQTPPSSAACGRQLLPREKPLEMAEPSPPGGEGVRGPARGRMRGEPAEVARLKGGHANFALISRLRAAASPEGEAFRTGGRSPSGEALKE